MANYGDMLKRIREWKEKHPKCTCRIGRLLNVDEHAPECVYYGHERQGGRVRQMQIYLAIGTRTWGRGSTPEEAKRNARKQGANYNRQPYEVYVTEVEDEEAVHVDQMGYVYTAQGSDFLHVSGPNGMKKKEIIDG